MNDIMPKKLKVLSLFSGIGGLDLGFEKAGFEVVATLEWDKDCCDTLRKNKEKFFSKQTKILQADITKIQPQEIYDGHVDFFIGGPPCQTFSAIGRRAGGASGRLDERGNLFKQYCRLLRHYEPTGFMFENVRGILSSNKGQDWKDVLKEFSALGYKLKYRILDTAAFGVAQHRERVILVGYKTSRDFFFPRPTHGPDSPNKKPYIGAAEALKGVEHTENTDGLYSHAGKYDELLPEIPAGSNYLYFTEEMGHPSPRFAWRSKFSDFLYKAHPDHPVKTIVASMGKYSGPFHWDGRKLSIGELLRLQGFPDGYRLCGGRTSMIKQIGNSVVPLFSYPLALAVKKTIFGNASTDVGLIKDEEVLSIETRKTVKAKGTRNKRLARASNQRSLFDEKESSVQSLPEIKLKTARYFLSYSSPDRLILNEFESRGNELELKLSVSGDILETFLVNKENHFDTKSQLPVLLELSINSPSFGVVKTLRLHADSFDPERPYILWDAINIAIRSISPFPSVHELYGHFTEPNPKFNITTLKIPNKRHPIARLFNWMSDFQNTEGTKPLSVLDKMGFDTAEERKLLECVRAMRIDLRTNLTNKRIRRGEFRICYPYTLPIDRRTFVTIGK